MIRWLKEEASTKARADQYGYAIGHFQRFLTHERAEGLIVGHPTVSHIQKDRMLRYIGFRKREGVKGETIHGELTAVRRALAWAEGEKLITAAPTVPKVDKKDRSKPKEVEYSIEQVAALLEAAWRRSDRHHVHLFTMLMLSTHARVEATLELFKPQIRRGLIYFNADDREQTTKRRPIVPVCPTLAPWLEPVEGKVIRYRTPLAERKWADPKVPEFFERDCYDIGNAFESCLLDAGAAHPGLKLCKPKLDEEGRQVVKVVGGEARAQWKGIGSPNTLRHTCHTYLQTVGVPQAQIDAAAGHVSDNGGTGRNYTHLRPEYLKDFVAAIEAYWEEMLHYTNVHVRSQSGPKVLFFDAGRAAAGGQKP